ncbi:MAG: radical SAM protein [Acidobacteria bacterium]|nr:radical SAM protein [Acidobacteriota bacterium]
MLCAACEPWEWGVLRAGVWHLRKQVRQRLSEERGTLRKEAGLRIALCYPSPYPVGMSSLGFQTVYREIHAHQGATAERVFLPDSVGAYRSARCPLFSYEGERLPGDFEVIAFSISYELEITGVFEILDLCGIPLLREERSGRYPLVIAGGPLTYANPLPLAPFVDLIILGEAEGLIHEFLDAAAAMPRRALLEHLAGLPGFYVPGLSGCLPPLGKAEDRMLPARSQIITRDSVLSSMFLIEPERGCSRGCAYCVMRRTTNGGMRLVPPETVLSHIPDDARRVGLVGAAVTDHPGIKEVVRAIVKGGREVGISSLRAERLDEELVGLLARGGYRTLTTASDGASQRLRDMVGRRTDEKDLIRAAQLARQFKLERLKLYQLVGLPGETVGDIEELMHLALDLSSIVALSLAVSPFVAKRNTPLDGSRFESIPSLQEKLARLRVGLRGKVDVRPASVRWAWVEYMLSQGDENAGRAAMDAWKAGGRLAAWQRALKERGVKPGVRGPAPARWRKAPGDPGSPMPEIEGV